MDLSIVIPTHFRSAGVVRLLQSLSQQLLNERLIEVLVVTNIEDQELRRQLDRPIWPFRLQCLCSGSLGVNKARNLGVSLAQADWVLLLDDDVVLPRDYLARLFGFLQLDPDVAAIGGPYHLGGQSGFFDRCYHKISDEWYKSFSYNLLGGNTLYNRNLLGHYLKFREDLIFGGAETELNLRLLAAGKKLQSYPELWVWHETSINLSSFLRKAYKQGQGYRVYESLLPATSRSSSRSSYEGWPLSLYEFFFRVGYRSKDSGGGVFACWRSIIEEVLELNADKVLATNSEDKPYHEASYPGLRIRKIYHWCKGNIWIHVWKIPWWRIPWFWQWRILWFFKWILLPLIRRIPWFIKWRLIPYVLGTVVAILNFFAPISTVGLSVPYNAVWLKLEGWIKSRLSRDSWDPLGLPAQEKSS